MRRLCSGLVLSSIVVLAGCGGGGSSSPSPTPTPTPAPGAVTSSKSSPVALSVGGTFGAITFTQTSAAGNLTISNTCNSPTGGPGVLSVFGGSTFSYSSATGIATYTLQGQLPVTAVATGTCTITATPTTGTPLIITVTVS